VESFPTCPPGVGPTGFSLYWGDDGYERLLEERHEWQLLFDSFQSQQFIDWCVTQFAEVWLREGCAIDLSQAKYVPYREDRIDKERATLRVIEHQPHELWVRMDIHQGRLGYSRPVHLDHARRLLSMLVYMCDHTENQMTGGELFLHADAKPDSSPVKRITPQHNFMVAFPCGRRSHHSVPTITSIGAPRNYIQVHISSSVDIWSPVIRPAFKPQRSQRSPSVTGENDLEASRQNLLSSLEGATDITLIRPYGNMGDQLIHAGTRRLLSNVAYQEVSLLHLDGARGQVAVIMGGGGWCKAHPNLPRYLPQIEAQFERVIVFPSSFDVTEESVKRALGKSKALFFARERESYEQIRGLCQADLAHDCALFFDFGQYQRTGRGLLTAYRTDAEAVGQPIPPGNNDISLTCESLDEFLSTIARYETVETDRAHVMIAAAVLGKRVYYNTSNYHKVPALAEFNLADYPLTRLFESRTAVIREQLLLQAREYEPKLPANFVESHQEKEVTIVMLSHDRLDQTLNSIRALREHVRIPFELLLVDNDSEDHVRSALVELSQADERIQLALLRENLGCTGGRNYATSRVTTPYVLLIDNDLEVLPGAVEHLLYQLEQHPKAVAVMGNVIFPDGSIHVCGGGPSGELLAKDRRFDEPIGESGPCDWVSGGFTLIRAAVFAEHPFDPNMHHYFEDFEWCHRLNQAEAGAFYRVVEALAIHFHESKTPNHLQPKEESRKQAMKYVETLAYFYRKHGFVYDALFYHVPELGDAANPFSVAAAKILFELVNSFGSEWVLSRWNREELAPLFAANSFSPPAVGPDDFQRTVRARDEAISWLREKWTESQETIRARDEAIAWLRDRLKEHEAPAPDEDRQQQA
jgi:GT2 family glycosyltransferase